MGSNKLNLFALTALTVLTTVTLQSSPQRIISGIPSITETLYALDLGDKIVGVTTNCDYPITAQKKEKVGGFFLNLEKLVSLKPDLIVMLEDAQKVDIRKLRERGLPVYTINPHTVDEVISSLLELGKVTGKEKEAQKLAGEMRRKIAAVRPKILGIEFVLRRPRVLAVIGYNPLIVAGGGTFIDDVVKCAGGRNIAASSAVAYPQYSFEALLNENPDYIIIADDILKPKEPGSDRRWQGLEAVRKERVLFIDADILSRPGPRVVLAIEKIAKFIHAKKN